MFEIHTSKEREIASALSCNRWITKSCSATFQTQTNVQRVKG